MINNQLTMSILNRYNKKEIGNNPKIKLKNIPVIDNKTIINLKDKKPIQFDKSKLIIFFNEHKLPKEIQIECENCNYNLSNETLEKIGIYLYPTFAYGVLNGGSATSYVDKKKNKTFSEELYISFNETFNNLKHKYKNIAKGITPAFVNSNGTPGPSFMELKMRSLLLEAKKYNKLTRKNNKNLFPIFQMTSTTNNESILDFYKDCKNSEFLKDLINETNIDITNVETGVQPLIAAFTSSKNGQKKEIFTDKDGKPLPLPGGHGQCFLVLKEIFQDLFSKGIKYVSIGNVDNIGYTVDPISLAILAISKKQAVFDFSFKTTFDVKGGILIRDQNDQINCADLGVAITEDEINLVNTNNDPLLFNCATGIFNLEYLLKNIDYITNNLPTRFTDQNKDAGEYSQAEQVTWEIISLLDNFTILAVDKYDRFLASKLLIENLVTSGLQCNITDNNLKQCAYQLNKGLVNKLSQDFDLNLVNGEWKPKNNP